MKVRESWIYWMCQAAGWGGYSAVIFAVTTSFVGWRADVVVGFMLFFAYSIGLTHLLRLQIRRRRWPAEPALRGLPKALGSAVAVGIIQTTLVVAIARLLAGGKESFDTTGMLSAGFGIVFMTCAWTAIYFAIHWYRRYREAQMREMQTQLALRQAELRALQAQVNPHFLFNSLNAIRGTVQDNPEQAQDMITSLANLFRRSLRSDGSQLIALAEEIDAVADYLALESARFEERLKVELQVAPEAKARAVPTMLLQTLVENAVRHGIATLPGGGTVRIRGLVEDSKLVLEVENTGTLRVPGRNGTHTGLANARERLRLLCGAAATLDLIDTNGTVTAKVVIPQASS